MAKLDATKATQDTTVTLQDQFKQINQLMFGVVLVLFITLAATFGTIATLVISHFDSSQETYLDLRDKVIEQNSKMDTFAERLDKLTEPSPTAQTQ